MVYPHTTRSDLNAAYAYLLKQDEAYACQQTPANNHLLIAAQRTHQTTLRNYAHHNHTPQEARTLRAQALYNRAVQNARRLLDDSSWQSIAHHQIRRIITLKRRVRALNDYETPPATPPTPRPRRLPTAPHPITGRRMYYDAATDTYHKQQPYL